MVFTKKSSKKRPAPAQDGPKSKRLHVESGNSKADNKKRSRPVTQPLDAQDPDSESQGDDIDVEEEEEEEGDLDDHEEKEDENESAMQVDARTDENKIPKDPNGMSPTYINPSKRKEKKLTLLIPNEQPLANLTKLKNCYKTNVEQPNRILHS